MWIGLGEAWLGTLSDDPLSFVLDFLGLARRVHFTVVDHQVDCRVDSGQMVSKRETNAGMALTACLRMMTPTNLEPPSFDRNPSLWHRRFFCRLHPIGEPPALAMQPGALAASRLSWEPSRATARCGA